eukprot:s14_g2.t1
MQGLHHLMAMSYREVETDNGAMQVFDYMVQQVNVTWRNQALSDSGGWKTCSMRMALPSAWNRSTAKQLQCLVQEVSPEVAKEFTEEDIDFFPMIVQNWVVDIFVDVLPSDAAARLWHHILLDNVPGVPLKFASQLLPARGHPRCPGTDSRENSTVICTMTSLLWLAPQNLLAGKQPVVALTPEDVDSMLGTDWTAPAEAVEAVPAQKMLEEIRYIFCAGAASTLKLPARAPLPKRWQPWKFRDHLCFASHVSKGM